MNGWLDLEFGWSFHKKKELLYPHRAEGLEGRAKTVLLTLSSPQEQTPRRGWLTSSQEGRRKTSRNSALTSSFANLSDLQQAFSALASLVSRNSLNSGPWNRQAALGPPFSHNQQVRRMRVLGRAPKVSPPDMWSFSSPDQDHLLRCQLVETSCPGPGKSTSPTPFPRLEAILV